MLASHAVRQNVPICRSLFERGRGKKKMLAYVAVQMKLLILIYTLWKKNEVWLERTSAWGWRPIQRKLSFAWRLEPLFQVSAQQTKTK